MIIGKFHIFSSAMLIIGFMSGSFMGQQMQFLELLPKYKCSDASSTKLYDCYPYQKNEDPTPSFC